MHNSNQQHSELVNLILFGLDDHCRTRFRAHLGESTLDKVSSFCVYLIFHSLVSFALIGPPDECNASLRTFGIPSNHLKQGLEREVIKEGAHRKWLRQKKEEEAQKSRKIAEQVGLVGQHDVLFGRG